MEVYRVGPVIGAAALLVLGGCAHNIDAFQPSVSPNQSAGYHRCQIENRAIVFSTFLPDHQRFVYVSAKALPGLLPSVLVIIDKNFEGRTEALGPNKPRDPMVTWWLDRSQPMQFSTNEVKITWVDDSGLRVITSLIVSPDNAEASQQIAGLVQRGDHYEGMGTSDNNAFAFQTRVDLDQFTGDEFDLILPSVTIDGSTVTPPTIHFTRIDAEDPPPAHGKC